MGGTLSGDGSNRNQPSPAMGGEGFFIGCQYSANVYFLVPARSDDERHDELVSGGRPVGDSGIVYRYFLPADGGNRYRHLAHLRAIFDAVLLFGGHLEGLQFGIDRQLDIDNRVAAQNEI